MQNKVKEKIHFHSVKDNSITCVIVIFTSLFCICSLYTFDRPNHVIYTNNINKLFLKSLIQRNTMDLDM